jgi:hypothetical protein
MHGKGGITVSKEKRIALKLEFYLRGKHKKPAVSFLGVGNYGVPLTGHSEDTPAFDEFSRAAHKFCKQIAEAGELD